MTVFNEQIARKEILVNLRAVHNTTLDLINYWSSDVYPTPQAWKQLVAFLDIAIVWAEEAQVHARRQASVRVVGELR